MPDPLLKGIFFISSRKCDYLTHLLPNKPFSDYDAVIFISWGE
ncbi:hypothetical protein CHCC5022_1855 [Bacillus paralicheniformis]|nr:hypothetical protein CHCC5022_1855 [Bacillus paralicheniformis]TWJ71975.1 hypothetical protein CHCC4186_3240 [Bacillus paralicheniformis]